MTGTMCIHTYIESLGDMMKFKDLKIGDRLIVTSPIYTGEKIEYCLMAVP